MQQDEQSSTSGCELCTLIDTQLIEEAANVAVDRQEAVLKA